MAKKENAEISISKLEKYVKVNGQEPNTCAFDAGGESIQYTIKYRISLEDCIKFVDDVVKGCIDKSEVSVIEIARKFLINRNLMTYYSNFRMPSDISKAYAYVMGAEDIVEVIKSNIDKKQYQDILDAIDKGISFERDKMLCEQRIRVDTIIEKLNSISEQMDSIFSGIDGEEASKFISTIANAGQIDSKSLAEVFVRQVAGQ